MSYPIKTARFWVYVNNGWVKLSLRPDEAVEWDHYQVNEEGYTHVSWRFENDAARVLFHCYTAGRDCDGRYESDVTKTCNLNGLKDYVSEYQPDFVPGTPDWQELRHTLRDHTAEAAGY